jgi:hypothetical protein
VTAPSPARRPADRWPRYSLYRYEDDHWAIDCEPCGVKIANLQPGTYGSVIIDRLTTHDRGQHGEDG